MGEIRQKVRKVGNESRGGFNFSISPSKSFAWSSAFGWLASLIFVIITAEAAAAATAAAAAHGEK